MTRRVLTVVERRSSIPAPADEVWARVTTPAGINDELMPVMRMTIPRQLRGATIDDIPLGRPVGRAWLLLFGVLPFDADQLMIIERGPGSFHESSTMLSLRRWEHERTVAPSDDGTEIHDRFSFQLRAPLAAIPGSARALSAALAALLAHRHRRLHRFFARPHQ